MKGPLRRRSSRGLTVVAVLIYGLILAGIWWVISFGGVYWDHVSIKQEMHEAANLAMKDTPDGVRRFLMRKLGAYPGLNLNDEDLVIEMEPSKHIRIDVRYTRTVKPLLANERTVSFSRTVEQDLKPVKW